jgi:hypothetical protein
VAEQCDILYRREINSVGSDKSYTDPASGDLKRAAKDRHTGLGGLHVVLSTRLAGNITPLTAERLADLAIDSARKLTDGRDGISYLMNAKKNGIETPLSDAYAEEVIRRLPSPNLQILLRRTFTESRAWVKFRPAPALPSKQLYAACSICSLR